MKRQYGPVRKPRIIGYRRNGAPIWLGQGASSDDPIEALQRQREEKLAELEALDKEIGDERRSDSQKTQWETIEKEIEEIDSKLDEQRSAIQERDERRSRLAQARAKTKVTQIKPGRRSDNELFDVDYRSMGFDAASQIAFRDKAMAVIERPEIAGHLTGRQKDRLDSLFRTKNGDTDGELLAAFTIATSNPHYRSAFQKAASGLAPVFSAEEARAVQEVAYLKRAMSVGTPAAGGYAVPVVIDPTIILTAQGSENDILRLARVETITNDTWRGLSSSGVTWRFGAEASASTDNSPTIGQPEVQTHRADGFIPFSIEIGQDWPGFAERMSELLGEGYSELLAEKLTTGTGADNPHGLIVRLAAQTSPDVSTEVATAATIAGSDIYDMWARLPQRHRRKSNTAWMSSTDVQNAIRQLGTVDPNFTVDITEEGIARLFGREYPMNDYMEDLPSGTGTEPLLVVGDFRGFLVAQRAGMNIEFVPMLFDVTNNRPTGQRGWFAWARVGSDVVDGTAFQVLTNKSS